MSISTELREKGMGQSSTSSIERVTIPMFTWKYYTNFSYILTNQKQNK